MVYSETETLWYQLPLKKTKGKRRILKTGLPALPGKLPAGTITFTMFYSRILSENPEFKELGGRTWPCASK